MKQVKQDRSDTSAQGQPRRSFFSWLWAVFGMLALVEAGWLTGLILRNRKSRSVEQASGHVIQAGLVQDIPLGSVRPVPAGQFYLSRLDDGSFIALSRTCTHLGCSVPWDEQRQLFICPCHGSTFDKTGIVLSAPAARPLDYFPVRIENGQLFVDTTHPIKRDRFDAGSQTVTT